MLGKIYKIKSVFVFLGFFGMMVFLGYRIFLIQVLGYTRYAYKARDMHTIEIRIEPKRGDILDRNGSALAVSVPMPSLYADPQQVVDPNDVAYKLADILGLEKDFLYERLTRPKRFVWLKRKIKVEEKEKIAKLKLKGIYFLEESTRSYPKGRLASHVLGFVNIDNEGMEGIELEFDRYLKGKAGLRVTEKDAKGREILSWRSKNIPPVDGYNIVLTIDEVIQYIVEEELDKALETYHPKAGIVIVMDPFTGEVLALANRPTFDPNRYNEAAKDDMRNRAVTDCFEPGSVFKMYVAGAALNEGLFDLKDTIFCENGEYSVPGGLLHDAHPYGMLTFQQVIEKSSNIGMAKVGQKLGEARLYKYLSDFGFGRPTGIQLPGEVGGMLHPPQRWSKMSITRIPMGHEVAVTGIQLTRAACAIANGGKLVEPLIVKRIVDREGRTVKEFCTEIVKEVIAENAVDKLKVALKGVVSPVGTAVKASLKEFSVAGKTGTAQKILPDGTYSHTDFMSSFVGFVPADSPRVVISVILDSPRPLYYGGVTAAPVFKNIAEKVLSYLDVEPEFCPVETLVVKR